MIYVNTHSSSLPICIRIQHVFKIFKVSAPWPLTQKILMWREGPDEAEASASASFGSSARCSSAARFENHWEIKPSWRALPLVLHRLALSLSATPPCVPKVCLDRPLHRPPAQRPGSGLGELAEAAGAPCWRQTALRAEQIDPPPTSTSFLATPAFSSSFKAYSTWTRVIAISSAFKKRSHIT